MKGQNWQEIFLNSVRKEKIVVQVYLTNGYQLRGIVVGFDNFVIVLEGEGKQNVIYKHAISTIIPSKMVKVTILPQLEATEAELEKEPEEDKF